MHGVLRCPNAPLKFLLPGGGAVEAECEWKGVGCWIVWDVSGGGCVCVCVCVDAGVCVVQMRGVFCIVFFV